MGRPVEKVPDIPDEGEVDLRARVRAARWHRGMTFSDISHWGGARAFQAFERVERGWSRNPRPATQAIISAALGVDFSSIRAASVQQLREWAAVGPPGWITTEETERAGAGEVVEIPPPPITTIEPKKDQVLLRDRRRLTRVLFPHADLTLNQDQVFAKILEELNPDQRALFASSAAEIAAILRLGKTSRERAHESQHPSGVDPLDDRFLRRLKRAGFEEPEQYPGILREAARITLTSWYQNPRAS